MGRVRIALAEKLQAALTDAGLEVRVEADNLTPATGSWRTDVRLDVMSWKGTIDVKRDDTWRSYCIGSWDTMTECLRAKKLHVEWDGLTVDVGAE